MAFLPPATFYLFCFDTVLKPKTKNWFIKSESNKKNYNKQKLK